MRASIVCFIILICCSGLGDQSFAQSNLRYVNDPSSIETLDVPCGSIEKENCSIVLPEINNRLESRGIKLRPLPTQGSVASLKDLCRGVAQIAVVQEDALVAALQKANCAGIIRMLGTPLYPYAGFLIARSEIAQNNLSGMVRALKPGEIIKVAAGGPNSGGDLTLRNILENSPKYSPYISIAPYLPSAITEKFARKEIDAYFLMESLASNRIKEFREAKDPLTLKPLYKIIDLAPDQLLLSRLRRTGLYGVTTIEKHWLGSIKTITNPSVIAIREDFFRDHREVAHDLEISIKDALPSISVRAGVAVNWRKEFYQAK